MLDAKGRQKVWALLACLVVFSWLMAWHLEPRHLEYLQAQGHVSSVEEQNSQSEGVLGKTPFQSLIPVLLQPRGHGSVRLQSADPAVNSTRATR